MKTLFDFKSATRIQGILAIFEDKKITKHSERTYEVDDWEFSRVDIARMTQFIGSGHILAVSTDSPEVFFWERKIAGRRRLRPRAEDLDSQTLLHLESYQIDL